ncbi:MAG: hypothetical protein A2X86_07390 [Bdellovibrionales bacterium GWA2_49_15]|nr:MAG: hypothetical protein A2X86_07390 [Bdellovibrionales bacterium GWA2_49_15]HAZ11899.1 hypothetical protein [Bdellovibrionales bacterium]
MDILVFILRYTPFWAIPMMLICAQFAYIFWLKSIRPVAYAMTSMGLFCLLLVVFYYWVGGPEKVGPFIQKLLH